MSNQIPSGSDGSMRLLINGLDLDTSFIDRHSNAVRQAEALEAAVEQGRNYYDSLPIAIIMLKQIGDVSSAERQLQGIQYWQRTTVGVEWLRSILKHLEEPLGIKVYDE
jgi:hypothetical protein